MIANVSRKAGIKSERKNEAMNCCIGINDPQSGQAILVMYKEFGLLHPKLLERFSGIVRFKFPNVS